MSSQHKRQHGRHEFRSWPLITTKPLTEINLHDYVRAALDDVHHLGTRKGLAFRSTPLKIEKCRGGIHQSLLRLDS
jgi:hypothetical protein